MKSGGLKKIQIPIAIVCLVAGLILFPATTALAGFGIDPGKVHIDNLYPGAQAEFKIAIYNQNDQDTTFTIVPRVPDNTKDGREAFIHLDWFTINPDEVTIKKSGKEVITVTLVMPDNTDYHGKISEVWISCKQKNDDNMVQIEIVSRIFINTKANTSQKEVEDELGEQPTQALHGSPPGSDSKAPITGTSAPTQPGTISTSTQNKATYESLSNTKPWLIFATLLGVPITIEGVHLLIKKRRQRQSTN